jgi:23S rRNA (uracil1939-C5)-methyltransferase
VVLQQGQRISVRPHALDAEGDAIASASDCELSVPGALPGELVDAKVLHVARRSARASARVERIAEPSPGRRAAPCRHQGTCTGCPLMIAERALQADLKVAMLRDSFGLEVDGIAQLPEELGYRWSAKRVVGGRAGAIRLGSYARGSHRLAWMGDCLVDHADLAAAAREIEDEASRLGIVPYDEESRSGDLRYVWLKTDGRGQVLVTLVTASRDTRVSELAARLSAAGVAWCVQGGTGNAMRGSDTQILRGEGTLTIELSGERVSVGPSGFLQPNPRVAELAYAQLVGDERGRLAFDLYAGAGVTTALLRARFERVVPCESNAEAASALGVMPLRASEFLEQRLAAGDEPELIVCNPPRAGLGADACALLCRFAERGHLRGLGIMSCHPAALARDAQALAPAFRRRELRAYDTLPQTAHVELVACFDALRALPA